MLVLSVVAAVACGAEGDVSLIEGLEQRIGLILLIASMVVIALLIIMLFYLHSISEHLNWIRRIR